MPHLEDGLRGLEETRRVDLELGLDAVVFPAVVDVGPADMDVDVASADPGWRNGVWVANGNPVPRHLGIPTVTVPMGTMTDTSMPVGLTFAGRAYDDNALLALAAAFEKTGSRRTKPSRTPRLLAQRPDGSLRADRNSRQRKRSAREAEVGPLPWEGPHLFPWSGPSSARVG
ncbi:hypothetical protein [Streptomyces sp. NPDC127112]|uniref:hypothetical protein n=1 Tax=Streptomyces sp. NPDC127112 TaxID=3345364 RepID=UPI0036313B2A